LNWEEECEQTSGRKRKKARKMDFGPKWKERGERK